MSKLPLISAKEFFKILEKMGFEMIRQEGSHVFFRHPDGRTTVVPNHPGEKKCVSKSTAAGFNGEVQICAGITRNMIIHPLVENPRVFGKTGKLFVHAMNTKTNKIL